MKVLSIIIVINVLMLLGFVSGSQKNTRIQQKQTSENEYDTAQLVSKLRSYSKRILYAFRLWILRLTKFSTICSFITLAIGLAFFGFITNLMYKTDAKIHRKISHYSNKPELEQKIQGRTQKV